MTAVEDGTFESYCQIFKSVGKWKATEEDKLCLLVFKETLPSLGYLGSKLGLGIQRHDKKN